MKNAQECGFDVAECTKYCGASDYPEILSGDICSMPGANPCTWGPGYWCGSVANADRCGFDVKGCKKYCLDSKEYPDIQDGDICSPPLEGSDPCTWGPR